jgi:hypothetical protein
MCMDSQGENSIHNLPHIADFRLKCCILKENPKNKISGRNPRFPKKISSSRQIYRFHLQVLAPGQRAIAEITGRKHAFHTKIISKLF